MAFLTCCGGDVVSSAAQAPARAAAEEQALMGLLPAKNEPEGWQKKDEPEVYSGEALFEYMDGGADIYYEYGFAALVVQQYVNDDKAVSIELYDMGDSAGGFGIYSYNRHPTLSPAAVGAEGTIHSNGVNFWRDKYYVNIRKTGPIEVLPEDFMALAETIDKKIGSSAAEEPPIMKLLPPQEMVARSAVFARGKLGISNQVYVAPEDLFGLEEGESAAIARYRFGLPEFSVIIAQYKNEAACKEAFARMRKHFLGEESVREKELRITIMPGKNDAIREEGARLLFVANADTEEHAVAMLDRISRHLAAE